MGFTVSTELQLNKMRILLPFCSPKTGVDQSENGFVQPLVLGWLCPQLSLGAAQWGMMVGRVQQCSVELMIGGMFLLPRLLKPEMPHEVSAVTGILLLLPWEEFGELETG